MITSKLGENDKYFSLNAMAKIEMQTKNYNFDTDLLAVDEYMKNYVIPNTKQFKNLKEKIDYLIQNEYYEEDTIYKYDFEFIQSLYDNISNYNHKFPSFMGILKFYNSYAMKTFDNTQFLENYNDRVLMNSLFLGNGDKQLAIRIANQIMLGNFQPATPTFLNAGKKQRGEYVSCYLIRIEDNMESISRAITTSLQLSKRGGGVSICLSNLREFGSPIKNIVNQSTGIVPVMKLLEDSFSYANQLGQRQGAGSVYLNVHHPEILTFLDTKRENADEKIRIKSLSLGIIIPDITFELAKRNEKMALFSVYDVQKEYKKAFSDISITEEYYNMVNNPRIKKTFIDTRKLFQSIATLHFEAGYPYILFDDTVNRNNPHKYGRIVMSNLCSEIAQVSTASEYNEDLSFKHIGEDISCNLGSLNIDKVIKNSSDMQNIIDTSIRALNTVANNANLSSSPSVKKGNENNRALGLGAMNLHGFFANHEIQYDSPEAIEFTDLFFYTVSYYAFMASNNIARENNQTYSNFSKSEYATGKYFEKYTKAEEYTIKSDKIRKIFDKYNFHLPTKNEWIELVDSIKKYGLANSHLLAVAPTGSISYLSSCTPSLQPIVSAVEVRKEGKLGRVYVPAYNLNKDTIKYYEKDAYELGPNPIIDIAAAAQKRVDQAISLTLFMKSDATTRDLNKAYIRAFSKGCVSIYYVRIRQDVLEGSEIEDFKECESCKI